MKENRKKIFVTVLHLKQIELQRLLLTRAPISVLPSNISTMMVTKVTLQETELYDGSGCKKIHVKRFENIKSAHGLGRFLLCKI